MNDLYLRIENLCKEQGITVTDLCRFCEIPRATLSDFKCGRVKSLSAAVLNKIAQYFSVTVDYILGNAPKEDEDALKVALFGGGSNVTDEMWNEVKRYAMYIKEKNSNGN